MKINNYLIITNIGNIIVRKNFTRLKGNEIAVNLVIDIPDAMFQRPVVKAEIVIPVEAVPVTKIDSNITDNIKEIIKTTTGLEMHVSVVEFPSITN